MKNRLKVTLIAFSLLSMQVYGQEKKTLTLDEAIDLGIQNSKQLKSSQAKIDEATGALREALDKKLPDASISGSYLRLTNPDINMKAKSSSGSGSGSSEPPKINDAMYGIVNVSLPLYTGGRIRYGIESSRFLEQATRLDAEKDKDEVIENTIESFANLFKAKTAVRLMNENLVQSQQRVKDLGNLEKNGLLARNDLLKAQLQASNNELGLLDAQNNWQLANVNMDLLLGLPTSTELILDTTGIVRKEDARVLDDYIQAAMNSRKDLAAIDLRKKAAESGVKVARSDLFPSLAVTGGYIAANVPGFISITNAVDIGVGVSYNIGSLWKNKAKVKQAEARVKQMTIAESMLDDNVHKQVNKNYFDLVSSRKKIEVYNVSVQQAEENYRIVNNKFNNGLASTQDLLDADVAQLQARLGFTLARADAFVAYHKLLQTAGILSAELKK